MAIQPGLVNSILMAVLIFPALFAVYFLKKKREIEAEMQYRQDTVQDLNAYSRSLIEVNINPLVLIDPDRKIMDMNAAMEMVTGHFRKELIDTVFSYCYTEPEQAMEGYLRGLRDGMARDLPPENLYLRPFGGMNA